MSSDQKKIQQHLKSKNPRWIPAPEDDDKICCPMCSCFGPICCPICRFICTRRTPCCCWFQGCGYEVDD